jgi:hypothetical protein
VVGKEALDVVAIDRHTAIEAEGAADGFGSAQVT